MRAPSLTPLPHPPSLALALSLRVVACVCANRAAQAAFRGMSTKSDHKAQKEAAAKLAAVFRGRKTRESTTDDLAQYRAATRLQAGWRAHLARGFVDRLRWQSKSRLQRTFSWSKKGGKRDRPAIKKRTEKEILEGMGVESNRPKAPVRRSMSFNRFSKGTKSIVDDGRDEKAKEKPANSKQLLFILLQRGPTGLGLELDATNTVVNIVPGGAADTQGYFREGDTIASVDGIPLRGRLLQDVMDRSKNSYSFDVWRLTPVEREPEVKKLGKVRRAFSFDRKR